MPKKDSSFLEKSGLYGTWTFTTQTMTDVGYYKGLAYVVMHVMPDPMQVKSCVIEGTCIEADNQVCNHAGGTTQECVDIETSPVEWSDVNVFFQFGFRVRTGIVKKTYHEGKTSDWVGPFNIVMSQIPKHHSLDQNSTIAKGHDEKDVYVSRYVTTPWTDAELQRPKSGIFNFDANILEEVVGLKAINETILHHQKDWGVPSKRSSVSIDRSLRGNGLEELTNDDPYARYSKTCAHGALRPILPKLVVVRTKKANESEPTFSMKLDYSMLSLPEKDTDDMYNLWPSMKSHLGGQFPLRGPYCYGKDPNRAWAIHLGFDSAENPDTAIWKGVKGCVEPWPCWNNDPKPPSLPPSSLIPEDNQSQGSYILDPKGLEMVIVYSVGFLLVVSLILNLQLANKLKAIQQSTRRNNNNGAFGQDQTSVATSSTPPRGNRAPTGGASYRQSAMSALEASDRYLSRHRPDLRESSLEEPLLAADNSENEQNAESAQSIEESKQEAE